ncbi:MAG: hypothetical protein DBY22_00980 [Clostridiales bacterium]|nr:MAG: hypothetical protein DBY22_00980 [Clostridiales bacterium]
MWAGGAPLGVPPFIIVPFSNGRTRTKMPRKRPQTPRVLLPGYPRPTRLRKSAHSASRGQTRATAPA